MKKILVLGTGMIGRAMAADLSQNFIVSTADINPANFSSLVGKYRIDFIQADFRDEKRFSEMLVPFDIIVSAVPGFMGYKTLKKIINAGKNAVDISFFGEDPFTLDDYAKANDVTVVTDCGIAPGFCNMILGLHYANDNVKSYECYVGGLPFEREYPFQYKAPFSPGDVIEEYMRPARLKEHGEIIVKEALSEPEFLDFQNAGRLEAFNSDGLRSLLQTIDIPDMKEKTLRYPGHIDAIKILRDSGFFSTENILINNHEVRPLDVSSKLLFDLWKLNDEDDEFTVLRVVIRTMDKKFTYDLFDRRDYGTSFSSMARTTGFTCTAVVNLMAEGKIKRKGIFPPEYIGMDNKNYEYVKNYLAERKIFLNKKEEGL